ncbi:DUF4012 domain-containing protein [Microbacterium sp. KSW-18]|uniref:DUF4012 domain-containing protein n=1 Tax=Microbacterium aquilitoris TaxID=3067307 RepID=A0ABU3GJL4_9MICO|nr:MULTISPECIES: DUF4012 domain-containing protein [unclassified Microbacterium]MDT3329744.1 DUF4012 domain-containing protein [Microbacterium sp. KSW-18]
MRRRRRLILVAGALLLIGTAAAAVHVGRSAWDLKEALDVAGDDAAIAVKAVGSGDIDGAEAAADRLVDGISHEIPDDPVWYAAEALPGIGPNLSAARRAATAIVDVADDVAPAVLDTARGLEGADAAGAVRVLRHAAPALTRAAAARDDVAEDLADIDRNALFPQLANGVGRVVDALDDIQPLTDGAAQAADLVPTILGAEGDRRILVVLQNTAELRTGGGITGTFLELRAHDGILTLGAQRDSSQFSPAASPLTAVPAAEVRSLGDGIGRYVQNTSMTADFRVTAQLASAWWQKSGETAPDVVVSMDPVVLSAILGAIGPVETSAGVLDQKNVIDRLLVEPYRTLDQDAQGRLFSDAAAAVFTALTERARPAAMIPGLAGAVEEGRISVWSRHPDEQKVLARTALAGPLARQDAAGPNAFAAYFNDATGGKLTPYLTVGLATRSGVCRADGLREVEVEVSLGSTLTKRDAETLPVSVTGGGFYGAAAGDIAPTVTVVTPPGWFAGGVTLDGAAAASVDAREDGRVLVTRRVDLAPGGSHVLTFRFIAGPDVPSGAATPELLHTPLLKRVDVASSDIGCPAA